MLTTLKFIFFSIIISIFLQFVGFIWYGPLFGRIYLNLAHPNRNIKSPPSIIYLVNFIYTWFSVILIGFLMSNQLINCTFEVLKFSVLVSTIIGLFRGIHDLFDDHPLALNFLHSSYNFFIINISALALFGTGLLENNVQYSSNYVISEE